MQKTVNKWMETNIVESLNKWMKSNIVKSVYTWMESNIAESVNDGTSIWILRFVTWQGSTCSYGKAWQLSNTLGLLRRLILKTATVSHFLYILVIVWSLVNDKIGNPRSNLTLSHLF